MSSRWPLDGDGTAAKNSFVDIAMAAFAQELSVGEAIGGGFKVTVVEVLDLDGLLWFVRGGGFGGGRRG